MRAALLGFVALTFAAGCGAAAHRDARAPVASAGISPITTFEDDAVGTTELTSAAPPATQYSMVLPDDRMSFSEALAEPMPLPEARLPVAPPTWGASQ